ncbi:TonB-dependent receptor domain-containing protein, partial [Muribaculum intestinale]
SWQYEHLGVGDIVYKNYRGYTAQEGIYAQGEYTMMDNKFNFVLAGSVNNTSYWRHELFYADKAHRDSETVNFWAGTIKGGANWNIDKRNNVFFNAGYISRAPFFQGGAFLSYSTSNATNKNAVNEKVVSFEAGYGYQSRELAVTLNAYYTKWIDKTMARGGTMDDGNRYTINLEGVNARHMGVELNVNWIPVQWLNVEGMLSLGNWEWCSNASGYFFNNYGQPLGEIKNGYVVGVEYPNPSNPAKPIKYTTQAKATVNQKGVKVADSPQTQGSVSVSFLPFKGFRVGADWVAEARTYSDFSLSGSTLSNGTVNVGDPWQIPWGQQFDLFASYSFKIAGVRARLYGNVYNVFNNYYITDAMTNTTSNGTWENAYGVFYSFGRTYSIRMRINF